MYPFSRHIQVAKQYLKTFVIIQIRNQLRNFSLRFPKSKANFDYEFFSFVPCIRYVLSKERLVERKWIEQIGIEGEKKTKILI